MEFLADWIGRVIAWGSKEATRNLLGTLAAMATIIGAVWAFHKWLRGNRKQHALEDSRSSESQADLADLASRLAEKQYDFLGHPITLLTIFTHARTKLARYVSISYLAMDILQELSRENQLPPPLVQIAQKDKWWNDEALRLQIVQIGDRIVMDCLELGLIKRYEGGMHEPEYVISELGFRLGNYLAKRPSKHVQYSDADWITAAFMAPRRAASILKAAFSSLSFSTLNPDALKDQISTSIDPEIEKMKSRFEAGGDTTDQRVEACCAKHVADLLLEGKTQALWALSKDAQPSRGGVIDALSAIVKELEQR
jgi:hypothetical protein